MGQKKNQRRFSDTEAMAKGRMIKTSPQKLNLVAQTIRGLKVEKALAELSFSRKRVAQNVKKVLGKCDCECGKQPRLRHRLVGC